MSESSRFSELNTAFNRLIYAENAPSIEDVLGLGAELCKAHLAEFIYETIDRYSIARANLRSMLFAATRYHFPNMTSEERERVNDRGCVEQLLADIIKHERWPAVRSELVKFSKRAYEEIAARTPPKRQEGEPAEETGAGSDSAELDAEGDSEWLTVSDAAKASGCTCAQISGAVRDGQLKSNGMTGRKRRIDPADLAFWQLRRANRKEAVESNETVAKKLRRAQNEQRNYRPA
jgi:hypothetical protein